MTAHRRWTLARRPDGVPVQADFALIETPLAPPDPGGVVVEVRWISVDPGMRARLSGDSYAQALALGETIESAGVGVVMASDNPKLPVGAWVSGPLGWQSHVRGSGRGLKVLPPDWTEAPLSPRAAIGVLGVPGLTAYFGLLDLGAPQPGETALISSAAGTVGATALQIARIKGLRTIGIAGGADKCRYLVETLGADAAIDHRATGDLAAAIKAAAPRGVDLYFDNVGAGTLDAAILALNPRGRIIVSGQIAEYNAPSPIGIRHTTAFITKRLRMEGFVVYDHLPRFPEAQAALADWIRSGALTYREEIIPGLDRAPEAFIGLFSGAGLGRRLVAVHEAGT